ncbi:cytochrome C oxidase assembly protein [Roseivivax halodurans JCM 10272]|uniref:Cytochrome C oxidase assembly protein n=1 Tax=Roseivivax halodurans JCM 10272 TaxID=1449350 RepID=X7ELN5_9RHOB|nr:hypothetical protein [Roseivivax halodurans]ETX16091.1 cytochrome C oxidase assembly protein [Roseivivax halodurans JCM 10272]
MALRPLHELHHRRHGRNLGLGIVLAALIVIIFGLTMVKVQNGEFGRAPGTADSVTQRTEGQGG